MRELIAVAAVVMMVGTGSAATGIRTQAAASKQAPPGFDPCTLMTKEEASAALGEAVQQKPTRPAGEMPGVTVSACGYEAPSKANVQVTVWRPFGDSAAMFVQIYKSECLKKEQQAGLGDIACWYNKDHQELQMIKGTTIVTFELRQKGNATNALMTVAKKALTRLP